MNWTHETWRRLYCREEGAFACLPLYVRGYFAQLIKLANENGIIDLRHERDDLAAVVAMRTGMDVTDRRLFPRAVSMLEEAGVIIRRGASYALRDWEEAQRKKANEKRSRDARDRNEDRTSDTRVTNESSTSDERVVSQERVKSAESLKTASVVPSVPTLPEVPSVPREAGPPRPAPRTVPKPNALDALLAAFSARWERRHGEAYRPTPGDKSQLGAVLRMFATADEALRALPECFDAYLADADPFVEKQGFSLRFFCTSGGLNRYRVRPAAPGLSERDRRNVSGLQAWAERKRVELEAKEAADAQR